VTDDADTPKFRVSLAYYLDNDFVVLHSKQASTGTVQYAPDKSAFVWKIKQLGGAREYMMRAQFGLPSVKSGES
jgi:AP-1 complex subunit mu